MAEIAEFHLCGIWTYRQAGVEYILKALQALDMADTSYSFDAGSGSFEFICQSGDVQAIQEQFNTVHLEIEDEAGLEDVQLARSEVENDNMANNSWLRSPLVESAIEDVTRDTKGHEFPAVFDKYPAVAVWSRVDNEGSLSVNGSRFLAADDLHGIALASGTFIQAAPTGRLLYIGAASKEAIQKATKKLDTVFEHSRDKPSPGKHLLYSEAETNYLVDARYLVEINPSLVTSTALDPALYPPPGLTAQYAALYAGVGLRICHYDASRLVYMSLFGPITGPVFAGAGRRWSGLFVTEPQAVTLRSENASKANHVEDWMAGIVDVDTGDQDCPPGEQKRRLPDEIERRHKNSSSPGQSGKPVMPRVTSQQTEATRSHRGHGRSRLDRAKAMAFANTVAAVDSSADPTSKFISALKDALGKVMAGMRVKQGKLRLRADLGRICLADPMPGQLASNTAEEAANGWQPAAIVEILDTRCSTPKMTTFTRILSVFAGDAEYLVQLKDKTGNLLWDQPKMRVVYDFTCERAVVDALGKLAGIETFIVELDGTQPGQLSYAIRDCDEAERAVWVHCLRRNWDVRMLLTHTATPKLEGAYGAFAEALVKSIVMPTDTAQALDIAFDCANTIQRQGSIQFSTTIAAVRARHVARFTSSSHPSFLDLTYVRDTKLTLVDAGRRMVASPLDDDPTRGIFGSWYEASVSSAMAEEALHENETISTGDEARWTIDSMAAAGVVEAICEPALNLIKRMDGVGVRVDNHQGGDLTPPSRSVSAAGTRSTGTRGTVSLEQSRHNYW